MESKPFFGTLSSLMSKSLKGKLLISDEDSDTSVTSLNPDNSSKFFIESLSYIHVCFSPRSAKEKF